MRRRLATLAAVAVGLATAGTAGAAPGLIVGAADSSIDGNPDRAVATALDLGMTAVRPSVFWTVGQTHLSEGQIVSLDRAVEASAGRIRIVPAVYATSGDQAPTDQARRDQYCSFVRDIVVRYPAIRDVVIWVEPNKTFFWKPQYNVDGSSAAPAAYEALVAQCWDTLHAARADVNVIAASTSPRGNDRPFARSNVSHSPGSFIRQMGKAYRASGRTQRIFDTVGHHGYGEFSSERPWKAHAGTTIAQGDWAQLMQALYDAYHGTGQPIPGEQGVEIWYLEMGFQTDVDGTHAGLYTAEETDERSVSADAEIEPAFPSPDATSEAPNLGTQVADSLRLAFCQPYVGGWFNLMLADESDRGRWQSGFLWTDWTPKPAYATAQQIIAEVRANGVDCSALKGKTEDGSPLTPQAFVPQAGVDVTKLEWTVNDLGKFALGLTFAVDEDVDYVAVVEAIKFVIDRSPQAKGKPRKAKPKKVMQTSGSLAAGKKGKVVFPKAKTKKLKPGTYRIRIFLTAKANPDRVTTITSPTFKVKATKTKAKAKKAAPKVKRAAARG
ncbi:MAG: hypothetical protein R3C15_08555 [Thermoleophilia bacterium]